MPSKHITGIPQPKSGKSKKKQPSISSLKKKLWEVFSKYIRARDSYICFTCNRKGEGSGIHAGHFIPKSVGGILLYFHEENVRAQCYHCNINLGGNQWEYGQRLGEETVKKLQLLRRETLKWGVGNYIEKIEFYKEKLKEYGP